MLLPGCGLPREAVAAAERLRAAIAAARSAQPYVTVSAGVAIAPVHGREPAPLIAAADAALYRAKRGGRDKSELAQAPATADSGPWPAPASV